MNSAQIVYAQPEMDGEAIDPEYKRFLKGLDLTKFQIIPHYYSIKDKKLDGLRIIEDISYEIVQEGVFMLYLMEVIFIKIKMKHIYMVKVLKLKIKNLQKYENGNKLKLY